MMQFHEHFEPVEDSKVKVADVRRALGSQGNESNGRNFRLAASPGSWDIERACHHRQPSRNYRQFH